MAQTGRNMQVRFDLKVVLECWDYGILVFRLNIYNRLTQCPLLDHMSARPCAHFFSSISTIFYKFDAIFRSFYSIILPNALLGTDGNFILKDNVENHAFATFLKIALSGFQKYDNKNVTNNVCFLFWCIYYNQTQHDLQYLSHILKKNCGKLITLICWNSGEKVSCLYMVQQRALGEPIINIHSKYQNFIISAF